MISIWNAQHVQVYLTQYKKEEEGFGDGEVEFNSEA